MRSPKKIQQSGRSAELLTGAGEQDVDLEDLAEFMGRIRTSWSVDPKLSRNCQAFTVYVVRAAQSAAWVKVDMSAS